MNVIYSYPFIAYTGETELKRRRTTEGSGKITEPQKLSSSDPLHRLWTVCRDPATTLFKSHKVQRDKSHPSNNADVPSSCLVLEVQDWISELQPDSDFSGVLVREEYREALGALLKWFLQGIHSIPTEIAVDEDAMQVVDVPPDLFPNPFSDFPPDARPKDGPFVLLGHPGIGEHFLTPD